MEAEEYLEDRISSDINGLLAQEVKGIVEITTTPKTDYFLNITIPEFVFDVFSEVPGRSSRPTANQDRLPEAVFRSIL